MVHLIPHVRDYPEITPTRSTKRSFVLLVEVSVEVSGSPSKPMEVLKFNELSRLKVS